jgi:hypothetical protein
MLQGKRQVRDELVDVVDDELLLGVGQLRVSSWRSWRKSACASS